MRSVVLRGLVCWLSLLILAAFSADSVAGGKKVYKSPLEVFEAAKKAAEKEDIKTLLGCITADSRDAIAGGFVWMAGFIRAFGKFAKEDDVGKKLDKVLEKHGLTEEIFKKLEEKKEKIDLNDPVQAKAAFLQLAKLVKDRDGFILDIAAIADKKNKAGAFEDLVGSNPTLKDVKIAGDVAKGVLVGTKDGAEVRKPLEFRREDGSWKIDVPLPEMKRKKS